MKNEVQVGHKVNLPHPLYHDPVGDPDAMWGAKGTTCEIVEILTGASFNFPYQLKHPNKGETFIYPASAQEVAAGRELYLQQQGEQDEME